MTFTSGVVALVPNDFGKLEDLHIPKEAGEDDLECYIDIKDEKTTLSGETLYQEGLVAAKRILTEKEVLIEDGTIDITQNRHSDWDWARIWVVPDRFIVVSRTNGTFPFDKLSEAMNRKVRQAKFNLTEIVQDHPGHWMGGFEDREERVRSGTLYGDEIERDIDMGEVFISADKNQIGPIIEFDGREIKARVTADGFVQIVSPGDYEREKYLSFIKELGHTSSSFLDSCDGVVPVLPRGLLRVSCRFRPNVEWYTNSSADVPC